MPNLNGCLAGVETGGRRGCSAPRRCGGFASVLALLLAAASGSAVAAPARPPIAPAAREIVRVAVFGADDRVKAPEDRAAISEKIGVLVDLDRNTVCTAFCVGTDVVMTAAHCVYPASGPGGGRLDAIRFRQSLHTVDNDARIAGRGGRASPASILVGSTRLKLRPPIDAVSDWTVIRLDRNVCPAGGLRISRRPTEEIRVLARDKRIFNIGFHHDFENFTRALSAPCEVPRSFDGATWETIARDFRNADDLILHTCDTGGSSSGSPLLIDGPDGPEVVGINVGTYLHSTYTSKAHERQSANAAPATSREIANTAIAGHAVAETVAAFTGHELISQPKLLRELQSRLAASGEFAGAADGRPSPAFDAAIREAEKRFGLPETGRPTRRLLRRLP